MPIVQISLIEGRELEKINKLIVEVTKTVSESLDSPVENVRVIINEVPNTHWGIGGRPASEVRKSK
ncbi:4-oxalocrotonate tautomerase [Anaerobacillus isosaccharinicus]|uniref:Tautomerase n=1 Tax=Anaerobacillus isosaccharinicus TaxID=1532552 RepID=A0A1S2M9F5_9BACI|nr:4-oxalocrotonate tautomerase [Anaerobacillus isosaccharinicus]MBA5587189.1 4-oxalocrotonate tautomerase [Anaerobacillus isosaccharinicus]QOY34615.1 4-oxalocrotonate tautomerase [Anaerobacillus isosaccharinicus]